MRVRRFWWRERAMRRLIPAYVGALREIRALRAENAALRLSVAVARGNIERVSVDDPGMDW